MQRKTLTARLATQSVESFNFYFILVFVPSILVFMCIKKLFESKKKLENTTNDNNVVMQCCIGSGIYLKLQLQLCCMCNVEIVFALKLFVSGTFAIVITKSQLCCFGLYFSLLIFFDAQVINMLVVNFADLERAL